jgi:hypothetical protein
MIDFAFRSSVLVSVRLLVDPRNNYSTGRKGEGFKGGNSERRAKFIFETCNAERMTHATHATQKSQEKQKGRWKVPVAGSD